MAQELFNGTANELALQIVLITLQITAIYLSWQVGKKLGRARFWNLIIIAFSILIFRRIISFLIIFETIQYTPLIQSIDNFYIPFVFWICIVLGIFELNQRINNKK